MFKHLIMIVVLVGFIGLADGCKKDKVPEVERVETRVGDSGTRLGSDDMVIASDKAVEGIASVPEIRQAQGKTVIVVDAVENKTSDKTADFQIFLARIRVLLNQSGAKQHLVFVESRAKARAVLEREGQGVQGQRLLPKYALTATFYDMPRGKTNYHLLTFQLMNLQTNAIDWEGSYEVKLKY